MFYIDGQRVAKIGPGQKVSFVLPAGEVNLGTGLAESAEPIAERIGPAALGPPAAGHANLMAPP